MAQAITAAEIRETIEDTPSLSLPAAVTDPLLDRWSRRQTAHVLERMGLTALPSAGLQLDRIENQVLSRVLIDIKRFLHPDRTDMMTLLNDELRLLERDLDATKKEDPKRSQFGMSTPVSVGEYDG